MRTGDPMAMSDGFSEVHKLVSWLLSKMGTSGRAQLKYLTKY